MSSFSLLFLIVGLMAREPVQAHFHSLTESEFRAYKAAASASETDADIGMPDEDYMLAALARRGHSGDMTYLQGCDLSDVSEDLDALNVKLVSASNDWQTYQNAVVAGRIGVVEVALPTSDIKASDVIAIRQADQSVRRPLPTSLPEGEVGDLITQLQMLSMCEVDLRNGAWLGEQNVRSYFASTTDVSAMGAIYTMALHMDHLPALQDDYAQIYLRRREELGLPIEPGLRLQDRSRINLGLPQRFATLILCNEGKPVFAGQVDLQEANRLRREIGLPPEDLETKAVNGFCG